MGEQEGRVEEHADRGEEQQPEEVAQGQDVAESLMAVVRLAQHHARHKGAQRERQAEEMRGIADPQTDGGNGQQEQLARIPADDVHHQAGQQADADTNGQRQENHGFQRRESKQNQAGLRVVQLRQNNHQRHHREVLHDQHADHHPAGQRAHPALAHQGSQHDHGARQRNQGAEPEGWPPFPTQPRGERKAVCDGDDDLDGRADQGNAAHRPQVPEGEFQPQGEQQKRHADFGQQLDLVNVGDDRKAVRPDGHAGEDVTQHQRLPRALRHQPAQQGRDDDDDDVRRDAQVSSPFVPLPALDIMIGLRVLPGKAEHVRQSQALW